MLKILILRMMTTGTDMYMYIMIQIVHNNMHAPWLPLGRWCWLGRAWSCTQPGDQIQQNKQPHSQEKVWHGCDWTVTLKKTMLCTWIDDINGVRSIIKGSVSDPDTAACCSDDSFHTHAHTNIAIREGHDFAHWILLSLIQIPQIDCQIIFGISNAILCRRQ